MISPRRPAAYALLQHISKRRPTPEAIPSHALFRRLTQQLASLKGEKDARRIKATNQSSFALQPRATDVMEVGKQKGERDESGQRKQAKQTKTAPQKTQTKSKPNKLLCCVQGPWPKPVVLGNRPSKSHCGQHHRSSDESLCAFSIKWSRERPSTGVNTPWARGKAKYKWKVRLLYEEPRRWNKRNYVFFLSWQRSGHA